MVLRKDPQNRSSHGPASSRDGLLDGVRDRVGVAREPHVIVSLQLDQPSIGDQVRHEPRFIDRLFQQVRG